MSTEPAPDPITGYHKIRPHMEAAYPAVFTPRKTAPVPLALGVGERIIAELTEAFAERSAKVFMSGWTNRKEYRWAILTGMKRYALDGSVAGEISEAERAHARDWLVSLYAGRYAKRKTRVEEVGDPAKRFRELADDEELRLRVIEEAKSRIDARPVKRKRKNRRVVEKRRGAADYHIPGASGSSSGPTGSTSA